MNTTELIRANFALVVDRAPDLVERFYARLFAEQPQLKARSPARTIRPTTTASR